jgi:ribosomal-protein-alanine acetyltransferase
VNADWVIRRAGETDLDAIMLLESGIFGSDAWSRESMRTELDGEHTYYLVATRRGDESAVDGYAGLLSPRGATDADVQTIAVALDARRHGLGRSLVEELTAEAARRGARQVFLEVRADNPGAQALYRLLGFEAIGVRPRYYQPDDVDAVVMRASVASGAGVEAGAATGASGAAASGVDDLAPNEGDR